MNLGKSRKQFINFNFRNMRGESFRNTINVNGVKCNTLVEVTLEKVNHGKLKFTMLNGTASVIPNFQFTMANLTLVSCPDNSGKNKVELTPDNNLVTKEKRWAHLLVYLNHAYFVDSLSSFWTNAVITIHLWIHICKHEIYFPAHSCECLSEHGFQQRY